MKILGRKSGCRAVAHDLWDYIGERLPENALERVENHLAVCAVCRIEVEGMRRAQALLSDCRRTVPAPRSDWHDLQNRMRAEGMISSLTGRVLVQNSAQEQPERPRRRAPLALDWNRLSLAGSVAATLILSVSIYRLLETPALNGANLNPAANFAGMAQNESDKPQNPAPETNFTFGEISLPLVQVGAFSANTPQTVAREPHKLPVEKAEKSPIVWENKLEPSRSLPAQKKSVALAPPPSRKVNVGAEAASSTPPVSSQESRDARTRYIMRGLTPASFTEEDGIY